MPGPQAGDGKDGGHGQRRGSVYLRCRRPDAIVAQQQDQHDGIGDERGALARSCQQH
jgi:hypothetical protein